MTFKELGLDPKVLKAIDEVGYDVPMPIQAASIPHALQGKDVLGIAQTGTGKTASFTLPMISLLAQGRARARMPRSLIVCPTRELAAQVADNFETYGKYHRLAMALLIGGVSFAEQERLIDRGVDVLIATPGRLLDHFERGKLMLTGVQILVVDEADRMLDMGFIPDIERIFQLTPFTRQTLFFSATMPPEITKLTQEFLHNPERIEIAKESSAATTVTQSLYELPVKGKTADKAKRELLRQLIRQEEDTLQNAIVFCNRKRDIAILHKSLEKHGFDVASLHGDLDQSVRTKVLDAFRKGNIKVLIASDVAARGLDIPDVSHVYNYDVPSQAEDYVHRIGRTGRAGRSGTAIMISTLSDEKFCTRIEEVSGKPLPRQPLPEAMKSVLTASDDNTQDSKSRGKSAKDQRTLGEKTDRRDKKDSNPRSARSSKNRNRHEREDSRSEGPIIGLGDHVPAFLLQPIPMLKRSRKEKDETQDDAA